MIHYTEKGAGLHEAIAAAGHQFWFERGEWRSSDDAAVQQIVDGYTVDDVRAHRVREVLAIAAELLTRAVQGISYAEMAGWPLKVAQAQAYAASGDPAKAPMLANEARSRQISLDALVSKVGGNSSRLTSLESAISGTSGRHRDALARASTIEELLSYDITAGWPAV